MSSMQAMMLIPDTMLPGLVNFMTMEQEETSLFLISSSFLLPTVLILHLVLLYLVYVRFPDGLNMHWQTLHQEEVRH